MSTQAIKCHSNKCKRIHLVAALGKLNALSFVLPTLPSMLKMSLNRQIFTLFNAHTAVKDHSQDVQTTKVQRARAERSAFVTLFFTSAREPLLHNALSCHRQRSNGEARGYVVAAITVLFARSYA